jgi:hypothetical protein
MFAIFFFVLSPEFVSGFCASRFALCVALCGFVSRFAFRFALRASLFSFVYIALLDCVRSTFERSIG